MAQRAARHRERLTPVARWIILRTSGGQTLPLMRSLRAADFEVWSPARTIRRVLRRGRPGERSVESDVPILPTFLFAREGQLDALARLAGDPANVHPGFSIFRHGGRIPLVGDGDVRGLQEEEMRAAATMQAIRAAESHAAAERIRIAAIRSEAARRRATKALERAKLAGLRAQPVAVGVASAVEVAEMPAMAGVVGVVEAVDGAFARVRFGACSWKIEGWRLLPSTVGTSAPWGLAA